MNNSKRKNFDLNYVLYRSPEWHKDANCLGVGPEIFFSSTAQMRASARELCSNCQVVEECLDYSLESMEKFGVWGGLTPPIRQKIIKQRRNSQE